jgi:hypothetical protein
MSLQDLEQRVDEAKRNPPPAIDDYPGEITRNDVRRFAFAIGDENPLFHDLKSAQALGYADLVTPPVFLTSVISWGAGQPHVALRADGALADPLLGALFPRLRLMGAGQSISYSEVPICGMWLRRRSTFLDATVKQGRSGAFALISIRREFSDERTGQRILDCREDYIAR